LSRKGKPSAPPRREAIFDRDFLEDLRFWVETDRKTALRVLQIVDAVIRDPFEGIGKPEPLRHLLGGTWSRRITQEHRLVYLVEEGKVRFLQARYHY
jgi:toxin YoeB